jgi:hypothetical protein
MIGSIVAVVISITLAASAAAEPIRWEFRGAIDEVQYGNAEMRDLFPTSGEAIFSVLIDPDAAEACGPFAPGCYHYERPAVSEFTFDASIAGHNYFLPNQEGAYSNERVTVHPELGQLFFDNSLSEHLSGDVVGTETRFRPHALDFAVRWPGVSFGSYGIPQTLPSSAVDGNFALYLWTCNESSAGCVRQDTLVTGRLNSAVQVDEPLTFATLGVGLALLAFVALRRSAVLAR